MTSPKPLSVKDNAPGTAQLITRHRTLSKFRDTSFPHYPATNPRRRPSRDHRSASLAVPLHPRPPARRARRTVPKRPPAGQRLVARKQDPPLRRQLGRRAGPRGDAPAANAPDHRGALVARLATRAPGGGGAITTAAAVRHVGTKGYTRRQRRQALFLHLVPLGQQTDPALVSHGIGHSRQMVLVQYPEAHAAGSPPVQAVPF